MNDALDELRSIRVSLSSSESEALTSRIIPIIDVFEDGTIEWASPPAHALFGEIDGALVGRSIHSLLPEHVRERHKEHFARFWAHPRARSMGQAVQGKLVGLRRDGSEFPVAVVLYPYVHKSVARCRAIVVPIP